MEVLANVDKYSITQKIGSGKFATVHVCKREGNQYALKYIPYSSSLSENKLFLSLGLNEAKVLSQLDHPNIIKIYDFKEKGMIADAQGNQMPILYLVLELALRGEMLTYIKRTDFFPDKLARYYFKQLIDALSYVHSKGFAHLDLKPENILLDQNYNLKIGDFGFATQLKGSDSSGKISDYMGTAGYMAPEVCEKRPYSGEKADIFSSGVILFVMIAQHLPFMQATLTNPLYKLFCQKNDEYWTKICANLGPGRFPPFLRSLLTKMLAFNPADRPTLAGINAHSWMKGPLMAPEDAFDELTRRQKILNEGAEEMLDVSTIQPTIKQAFKPVCLALTKCDKSTLALKLNVKPYKPHLNDYNIINTNMEPENIWNNLCVHFQYEGCEIEKRETSATLIVNYIKTQEGLSIAVKIQRKSEFVHCIRMRKLKGEKSDFWDAFMKYKKTLEDLKIKP